jgi:Protein of unknown function (DUF2852)
MWWNDFWPAPWMFFGPTMMFLLMIVCMVAMFFMMRTGSMHRSAAEAGPAGAGFGFGSLSKGFTASHTAGRPRAFEEYREETLRRLDQEQKEFEAFLGHLRSAKDKAEFDQFMAERRARASQT